MSAIEFCRSKLYLTNGKLKENDLPDNIHTETLNVKVIATDLFEKLNKEKYRELKDQIIQDYQTIIVNREKSEKFLVVYKLINGEPSPLDPQEEMTHENLFRMVKKSVLSLSNKPIGDNCALVTPSLLATRTEHGKLILVNWCGHVDIDEEDKHFLGMGSYGIIHKVNDVSYGVIGAMKFARTDVDMARARREIENEIAKMRLMESHPGLIRKPRAIFNTSHTVGYLQDLYVHKDLKETLVATCFDREEGLDAMRKLFDALKMMHQPTESRGPVIHGDIKPENLFVGAMEDGMFKIVIADLGGARDLKNELSLANRSLSNPFGSSISPGYVTYGDFIKLSSVDNQEDWIKYQTKRDIFALAVTVWRMLSDDLPFDLQKMRIQVPGHADREFYFPITGAIFIDPDSIDEDIPDTEAHIKTTYGESIVTILKRAMSEDPDDRPSIDEILQVIDAA